MCTEFFFFDHAIQFEAVYSLKYCKVGSFLYFCQSVCGKYWNYVASLYQSFWPYCKVFRYQRELRVLEKIPLPGLGYNIFKGSLLSRSLCIRIVGPPWSGPSQTGGRGGSLRETWEGRTGTGPHTYLISQLGVRHLH